MYWLTGTITIGAVLEQGNGQSRVQLAYRVGISQSGPMVIPQSVC